MTATALLRDNDPYIVGPIFQSLFQCPSFTRHLFASLADGAAALQASPTGYKGVHVHSEVKLERGTGGVGPTITVYLPNNYPWVAAVLFCRVSFHVESHGYPS